MTGAGFRIENHNFHFQVIKYNPFSNLIFGSLLPFVVLSPLVLWDLPWLHFVFYGLLDSLVYSFLNCLVKYLILLFSLFCWFHMLERMQSVFHRMLSYPNGELHLIILVCTSITFLLYFQCLAGIDYNQYQPKVCQLAMHCVSAFPCE